MKDYLFVIDTEKYAGNFEREMCAYITGTTGDCGVGKEEADKYAIETKQNPLDFIEQHTDEHGCYRPCEIYATPGWFNHGMGGHFRYGEEKKALKHYIKEMTAYNNDQIKDIKASSQWTKAEKDEDIKELKQENKRLKSSAALYKHPAYLSVAIFCSRIPSLEEIEFMKTRARKFNAYHKKTEWGKGCGKITGFWLVTEVSSKKEISKAV